MEQNLIDILIISKKGVQFSETLCSKASTVIQDGRADIEQLERTWAKLRFLANKATVQIRTVDSVAAYVDTIAAGLAEYCKSKHADLSDLSAELVHTFHSLRTRKVDEELLRNNLALIADDAARASAESRSDDSSHNPSSSTAAAANQDLKSTLFDYIDDQGVLELERQARTEIADVENLRSNLQSIYHSLIARIESFEHLLAPAFDPVFDQSAAAFARDQCVVQERETTAMADYLLSLTKHYDQVSHALELYQSQPESYSEFPMDISVLISDTNDINMIIEELQNALHIVESTSDEIRNRYPLYDKVYDGLVKLFLELDHFGVEELDGVMEGLKNVETEMEHHRSRVAKYFENLWNLVAWYEKFASAYDYLVLEIDRRHQVRARHERTVEEFARRLGELYMEEIQERNVWFEAHGRYLPMDLCPPIMDPPIQYDVTLVQDGDHVRLPVLTMKSYQEARANVVKRQGSAI